MRASSDHPNRRGIMTWQHSALLTVIATAAVVSWPAIGRTVQGSAAHRAPSAVARPATAVAAPIAVADWRTFFKRGR